MLCVTATSGLVCYFKLEIDLLTSVAAPDSRLIHSFPRKGIDINVSCMPVMNCNVDI